jgi:ABC-type enterochelin transport system substrate-binding protein
MYIYKIMRKSIYFLAFVAMIAMSACGNNESTTETGTTDSTTLSIDTTVVPVMESTEVSTDSVN